MSTKYNIKARLANISKKNVDVIAALAGRGINTNPAEFSGAINKRLVTPKAVRICETADEIITEWEETEHGEART